MTTSDTPAAERDKPEITAELDMPIVTTTKVFSEHITGTSDVNLDSRIKLSEQEHSHQMDHDRFGAGKYLIFVCILVMGVFALLDFFLSGKFGESELLNSAFEVLKLVTMTALGYIFSNSKK